MKKQRIPVRITRASAVLVPLGALAWAVTSLNPQFSYESVGAAAAPSHAVASEGSLLAAPIPADLDRLAASEAPAELTPDSQAAADHRSFDAIYRDLVSIFLAAQLGDDTQDLSSASELFGELAKSELATGLPAVRKLDALAAPWKEAVAVSEASVCTYILDFELQQMTKGGHRRDQRSALVSELIGRLPFSADYARLVTALLRGESYLEIEHEALLLDLASVADGDLAYMAVHIQDLLTTLWGNIDEPSDEHLARLVRVFDEPGALGRAAQQELMRSEKYRSVVMAHLIERGDSAAMQDLATFAAHQLPTDIAVDVARTFKEAQPYEHFSGAYIALAERSPMALQASYESSLAAGSDRGHREQAVLALAHNSESGSMDLARDAFDRDPDTRVRGVALLALAAKATPEQFVEYYARAVADEGFHKGNNVSYLVSSLKNVGARSDRAFLDQATSNLLSQSGLSSRNSDALRALRLEYLN